mgnify:CR=1 FL=1
MNNSKILREAMEKLSIIKKDFVKEKSLNESLDSAATIQDLKITESVWNHESNQRKI